MPDFTDDSRLGRCIKVIGANQGCTSRQVYSAIHDAGIMSEMAARKAVSELEEYGIIRREQVNNPRGGPMKLVWLCGDIGDSL